MERSLEDSLMAPAGDGILWGWNNVLLDARYAWNQL